MSGERDIRLDLEPDAPPELLALAERLERERPVPGAGFRGELRRRVAAGGSWPARPRRLGALIAGYATGGCALLFAGLLSVLGVGPLGA